MSTRKAIVRPRAFTSRAFTLRAFTLIELVVVVSIILVLFGMIIPSATALWQGRKSATAINLIRGLLMTSRADALQADGVESGFFAYVDGEGVQHLARIEQVRENIALPAWRNIFRITDEPDATLPPPMRIAPRYLVEDPKTGNDFDRFSVEELANIDYAVAVENQAQRHRNYFTVIFGTNGQMSVGRPVLILDPDIDEDPMTLGDRTKLPVGPGGTTTPATTDDYYTRDDRKDAKLPIDARNKPKIKFEHLLVDPADDTVALNFSSVDGLMVYDDSLLASASTPEEIRAVLLRISQPLYVSRWTGVVINGPTGENEQP